MVIHLPVTGKGRIWQANIFNTVFPVSCTLSPLQPGPAGCNNVVILPASHPETWTMGPHLHHIGWSRTVTMTIVLIASFRH